MLGLEGVGKSGEQILTGAFFKISKHIFKIEVINSEAILPKAY
jgi:hypothetical protein